jgi:DNA polymerase-3 subunit alpha
MLIATIDDGTAQLDVMIFNEMYEANRARFKEDALLVLCGKVAVDEYSGGFRVSVDDVFDLQAMREARARVLSIRLNGNADADRLEALLAPFRAIEQGAGMPVEISYQTAGAVCRIRLGEQWCVYVPDDLLIALNDWVDADGFEIVY